MLKTADFLKFCLYFVLITPFFGLHAHAGHLKDCEAELSSGPQTVLDTAMAKLKAELKAMRKSNVQFLQHYKIARQFAFQIEMLAKFLNKEEANEEVFGRLIEKAKKLEDRLGRFNETDEMVKYAKENKIKLPNGKPAVTFYETKRSSELKELRAWLEEDGWFGADGRLKELAGLLKKVEWMSEAEMRAYTIKRMKKVMKNVQKDIDDGIYDPAKNSVYTLEEVELKIHELRREIRKVTMYMSYLEGQFSLTESNAGLSPEVRAVIKHFAPLLKTPIADSPFAKLPAAAGPNAIQVPRALFVALTNYIDILGKAKDGVQNLERLHDAGIKAEIDLKKLDHVRGILKEIRETQLLSVLATLIKDQE